jgi:hypothetical protein
MELRVIIIWFVKKVQIFKIQYIYNKNKSEQRIITYANVGRYYYREPI